MKKLILYLTLITVTIVCILSFSACGTSSDGTTVPETTPKDAETTAPVTTEDPTKELRVLISSDVHCTDLQTWYGVNYRTRMQHWVDSVLKEHKENPFDLVVINGDISLDYWINGGRVIDRGSGTSKVFIDQYLSQLPDDLPVFVIPGNHEQYSDEDWFALTGNHRQGYMTLGGRLFIFLDNFAGNLDPTTHHDGVYTRANVNYIKELMDAHPDSDVYLIAHYFNTDAETPMFRKLIKENDRIKGLFAGHTHKSAVVELDATWGNKTIAQTGNFAYFKDTAKESFWGFRELVITDTDAYSQYVIVDSTATVDGVKTRFARTVRAQVTYYGTAPELPKEPERQNPLEGYTSLFSKIDQASVDGDVGMKETNRVQLIFDEKTDTKWCVRPTLADKTVSVTWKMTEAVTVEAYALATANDALDRSPDAWVLYGKNSETDEWTVISKVTKGNLPKELFTVSDVFTVEDPKPFTYYKLTLTNNFNNKDMYQFSELYLLKKD